MRDKRFLLKRRLDDKVVCDLDGLPIVLESDKQVLEEPALMKFFEKGWHLYPSEDGMGFYDSSYDYYHQVPESDDEDAKLILDNSCRLSEFYKTFDEVEIGMAEKFCESFYERYGIAAGWMTAAAQIFAFQFHKYLDARPGGNAGKKGSEKWQK